MPIEIATHESGHYFITKYEGQITDEGLIPAYAAFYANNDVGSGLPELVDLSLADSSRISREGLIGLALWTERFHRQHGVSAKKTAIYAPLGSSRPAAIIYEVWARGSPEIVRIFVELDEAIYWLTEQNETQVDAGDA